MVKGAGKGAGKGADGQAAASPSPAASRAGNPLLQAGAVDASWPKAGEHWISGKEYTEESDFTWMLDEEPHRSRRMTILKTHPEIKQLYGHEWKTKYIVAAT
jgi:sphingolipid delta-4 desaturase